MAATFEMNRARTVANWLLTRLLNFGIPLGKTYLLTVAGRRTGKPRTTPVTLAERDGQRYLVAPYGEVDWVQNARAAGEVILSRGRRRERKRITELVPADAAPIVRQYVQDVPVVRPFFDAGPDSPVDEFASAPDQRPVFRLESPGMG